MTTGVVQVQTALPDVERARQMAATLLDEQLAACVQVVGPVESSYRWQGKVEHATEWLCLIKSTDRALPHLQDRIRQLHPYETPEIIAMPVTNGLAEYLAWVSKEVNGEQ